MWWDSKKTQTPREKEKVATPEGLARQNVDTPEGWACFHIYLFPLGRGGKAPYFKLSVLFP